MGLYDRDYMHPTASPASSFRRTGGWSVTPWLIVVNVAAFVLDLILLRAGMGYQMGPMIMGPLAAWGHFSASTAVLGLQV
jgi:hypothetical protein